MTVELTAAGADGRPALVLRPWVASDAEAVAQAYEDPAMRRWLVSRVDGADAARAWIEEQARGWADGTRHSFAVLEEGGMRPLANVAVKRDEPGAGSAEIGYWTAAAARGRGLAPRAVRAVTAWALSGALAPPPHRLELLHSVGNTASCRVAVKCGFPLDAELAPYPPQFPNPGHLHLYDPAAGSAAEEDEHPGERSLPIGFVPAMGGKDVEGGN